MNLIKNKFFKIIIVCFYFLMMSGFSILSSASWNIAESDPTIWIKLCDTTKAKVFTNDLPAGDILGTGSSTGTQALVSIIADYNNVNSAYIRYAAYPDDPNNPGLPSTGDSTFTITKATNRTITACIDDAGGVATGGYAKPVTSENKITSCDIKIDPSNAKALKSFVNTLTHELGHCAGLDHPMETTNAIMSYFHSSDKYRLLIDDKMGLVFLYPNAGKDLKEHSTFGLSCSQK
jgi:hypothetical protein